MPDEGRRVREAIDALQIDTRAAPQVRRLSGGNQQKVTIARWLASGFRTMLCFDPTRGIDVGTKRQIYALLRSLADDGAAILFFSSELAEFPLVCDRVLTLYGGQITAELPGAGGRRGDAAARDARPRRGRGGGGVTTASAPVAVRRSLDVRRLVRRHGWTVGVYVLLFVLVMYWRSATVVPWGPFDVQSLVHRRDAARVRRVRAGDRDHLRRDRPLDRLADEPRQRRRGALDAQHELPRGARLSRSCSSSPARSRARSPGSLIVVTRVADIIVTLSMLFVWARLRAGGDDDPERRHTRRVSARS